MPDALGYQKINTLDDVESMPSFLEKQVATQRTIVEKQKKQQQDNASIVSGMLDKGGQDAWMFNDYYQSKFKEFRDEVIDKFSKNQDNPYNVLNDSDVRQRQIELTHIAEAGKTAQANIHASQAKLQEYLSKGEITQEQYKAGQAQIDGVISKLKSSKTPVEDFYGQDVQDTLFQAVQKPEKPFDAPKMEKIAAYGDDPTDNNRQIVLPEAIKDRAIYNTSTPSGNKYYQDMFDSGSPEEKQNWTAIAEGINPDKPNYALAAALTSAAAANPPKTKQSDQVKNEIWQRIYTGQANTAIAAKNADTNAAKKGTTVNITSNINGIVGGADKKYTYNYDRGTDTHVVQAAAVGGSMGNKEFVDDSGDLKTVPNVVRVVVNPKSNTIKVFAQDPSNESRTVTLQDVKDNSAKYKKSDIGITKISHSDKPLVEHDFNYTGNESNLSSNIDGWNDWLNKQSAAPAGNDGVTDVSNIFSKKK